MTLKQWLFKHNLTPTEFSRLIGKPQPMVWRYVHGGRIPAHDILVAIHKATKGEVTAGDWYGLIEKKRA